MVIFTLSYLCYTPVDNSVYKYLKYSLKYSSAGDRSNCIGIFCDYLVKESSRNHNQMCTWL